MPNYLILHGYNQSATIITNKIKPLLPRNSTLFVPNAPLHIGDDRYAWFPLEKIDLLEGTISVDDNDIFNIAKHNLGTQLEEFDGVIAFSQGCFAAIVLIHCGVVSTDKLLLFSPIPCPQTWTNIIPRNIDCLAYIGKQETLLSEKYTRAFARAFNKDNILIIEHRWGHVIPSTSEYKRQYASFLQD